MNLNLCPTCGKDRLIFDSTKDGRDHYRCDQCQADCSEPKRETFAEWSDRRAEQRIAQKYHTRAQVIARSISRAHGISLRQALKAAWESDPILRIARALKQG